MMKSTRNVYGLFLSIVVLFLFGCSGANKQKLSVDTMSQEPQTEAVVEQPQKPAPADVPQAASQKNPEAQQKLEFAENNLKMAQKGNLAYSQTVAICRDIIKTYPGTEYENHARMFLRQVPQDQRSKYNITNEELGL